MERNAKEGIGITAATIGMTDIFSMWHTVIRPLGWSAIGNEKVITDV